MELEQIQQALATEKLDGWLFYDFRKSNPIAYNILSLPQDEPFTRRWFYFVPAHGTPTALVSAVESHVLRTLPGAKRIFRTWQEMQTHLNDLLRPGMRITMEYSPLNAIPYMSRVDGGTLDLVRSFGIEVVSSANIAQRFEAQLTNEQIASHREAGRRIIAVKDALFQELGKRLRANQPLDEYSVQQRFHTLMQQAGTIPDIPHVAVNANAGNPDHFLHRTGHSIGTSVHANGANLHNYETQDDRVLLPRTCCSVEPGIYLPEFGIRSEVNLLILEHDAEVTGVPPQQEIAPLL